MNIKEQLLDEWMKENPPFDNNKESFEDFLVRQIRVQDANQAIQLDNKQKEIDSFASSLLATLLELEMLREQTKSLYSEEAILNKYYTDSAPNQHIKQNIIEDLKRDLI